jgi:programmed cell death 8 (apoptosis-inducing factor)
MRARPNIFAAGDVSSFLDLSLGCRRRVEHSEHAEITGRVVGENMTGGNKAYPRQAAFFSVVGTNAHITGVGNTDPKLRTIVVSAQKNPVSAIHIMHVMQFHCVFRTSKRE